MDRRYKPGTDEGTERTIEGGRSVVVFLELDLGTAKAPTSIAHVLHVLDDKGEPHAVVLAPLAVSAKRPIVVEPPLRGEWIAGDSVNNGPDAAHRRGVMVDDGQAWISQRYAIDWVQYATIDGKRTTWKGPEDKNESYICWDKPITSVADGTVVDASDGMLENVPHSGRHVVEINFNNAAGNHAVIKIAPHRYVLYAHMRPGSVKVKTGDKVTLGQVIGHVGNTGSSEEPHLHMHIDAVPDDALVVGWVWQHPNKSGGPNRRFKDNRQIPICSYEAMHIGSASGVNELVEFSRKGVAQAFADAIRCLPRQSSIALMLMSPM